MRASGLTYAEVSEVFCDRDNFKEKHFENYYLLLRKILNKPKILPNSILFRELKKCIFELDKRDKEYIILRYGLYDGKKRKLELIGMKYGSTREAVRQAIEKIIEKLAGQKSQYVIEYRIKMLKLKSKRIQEELEYCQKFMPHYDKLSLTVYDLKLSRRARNALLREGLMTYEQLYSLTYKEIKNIKNIGVKTAEEIWVELHEDIS